MCGIFGYVNSLVERSRGEIIQCLIDGLQRLEYRGYDSAGLAVEGENPEDIWIFKQVGRVEALREKIDNVMDKAKKEKLFTEHSGIAHTRWATHGIPSERNSHPHRSDISNEFVIVHNGVVTNYAQLKTFLQGRGHVFESDTDTEVVAKLAKYIYDSVTKGPHPQELTFVQLVKAIMRKVEGASAFIFKSIHYPQQLVFTRRGSPLLVGIKTAKKMKVDFVDVEFFNRADEEAAQGKPVTEGDLMEPIAETLAVPEGNGVDGLHRTRSQAFLSDDNTPNPVEFFIASDPAAIAEHTKKIVYLEDGDVAHIEEGELRIHRMKQNDKTEAVVHGTQAIQQLDFELDRIDRGTFPHFMIKEIFEQASSIKNTMAGRVNYEAGTVRLGGLAQYIKDMGRCRRMMFISCGTSYHACIAARAMFEELVQIPTSCERAGEFMDRQYPIFRDDVCVFVSQSGETKDTLDALRYCKARGALCVGLVNKVGSSISRDTHCGVHLNAGHEQSVASTKSYTSSIVVLILMALQLAEDRISCAERRMAIVQELVKLPTYIDEVLALNEQLKALANDMLMMCWSPLLDRPVMTNKSNMLIMSRGYQNGTAYEASLKIKEITYIHCEGIDACELKHGPLALVDENMPMIMIMTKDSSYSKMRDAFQIITSRRGRPVILCNKDDPEIPRDYRKFRNGDVEVFDKIPDRFVIRVPQTDEYVQSIVNIIPLQLLAYHMAIVRGCDPDNPRNLAKSVTV